MMRKSFEIEVNLNKDRIYGYKNVKVYGDIFW
jgi:hypothetical protein